MTSSILDQQWYRGDSSKVDLVEFASSLVEPQPIEFRRVMIGSDGQKRTKRPGMDFVSVVAVHNKGKGAVGMWAKNRFRRRFSLYEKLMQETWQSVEIALLLVDIVPKDKLHEIEIHIDANTDAKWASSKYHKTLAGLVTGQGFKCVLKPDAYIASHAADHWVKNKHLKVVGG